MSNAHSHAHLIGKNVLIEATQPIANHGPNGEISVAYPQIAVKLVAVDDKTFSVLREGHTEASVFERCNVRSVNAIPSELVAAARGLVLPNLRGNS